ncbi:MAG TPA: hypothetical protein VNA44_00380 [Burkholderiaceae bacterium]|nr:hypothetical protein [Burkholderiaceae bacterium]
MATSSRKTTDLERLTQPGGKVMPDDATIPVLTERLTLPSLDLDISLPQPPPPVVAPQSSAPSPPPPPPPPPVAALLMPTPATPVSEPAPRPAVRPAPPPSTLFASVASVAPVFSPSPSPPDIAPPAIDWEKMEIQLRESLLRELQPQLSAELERQVRDRLQPTLVRALTALISDLRPALDSTVRETISRAIAAELERQRSA